MRKQAAFLLVVVMSLCGTKDTAAQQVPAISWTPQTLLPNEALGPAQLNATSPVEGTFAYRLQGAPGVPWADNPAGIVLSLGRYQLTATFTPSDQQSYATVITHRMLDVNLSTDASHPT